MVILCFPVTIDGAMWLAEKGGVEKTKAEAQALIDAEIQTAQASYDALSDEEKALRSRPANIVLP